MARCSRWLGLFAFVLSVGCGRVEAPPPVAASDAPLIAGTDDRRTPSQSDDPAFAAAARGFVASLVLDTRVQQDQGGNPFLTAEPLYERHEMQFEVELCRDERFALEPTPVYCTGTLIAPDLLLTAGHCVVDADECAETKIVFGFEADASSAVQPLAAEDIYSCAELIVQSEPDDSDYALLRLDRPVPDRAPANVVRDDRSLPYGTGIAIAGHPLGLPLKISTGGKTTPMPGGYGLDDPYYFVADVDTFPGNSGSGAFLSGTVGPHPLAGVLSSVIELGSYRYDALDDCHRYERYPSITVWFTYAHEALGSLCALRAASYPALCGCGNGTCSATAGENGTTCATDCGEACGDGVCVEGETPASCAEDCGACGDGTCAPSEDCCDDCGCAAGFECDRDVCVRDVSIAGPGQSCSDPLQLEPTGTQTLHTPPGHALCYSFTLAAPSIVRWHGDGASNAQLCRSPNCFLDSIAGPEVALEAGTYYLPLPSDDASTPRTYTLSFSSAQPHDGLTCAGAIALAAAPGMSTVLGSTSASWHTSTCTAGNANNCYGPERHYTFTLDQPASITATASGYDHIALALRTAPCAVGGMQIEAAVDQSGSGSARLHRVLQPGTYRLIVDGEATQDRGDYAVQLQFATPPIIDGDDCSEPIVLAPTGAYSVSGNTANATNDNGAPASTLCATNRFGHDRFYTFTLTQQTRVDASVSAAHAAALLLTQGSCGAPVRCVRGSEEIRRVLNPGTYTLVVDGQENYDNGPYMLSLEFTAMPPREGESCEDALVLAPSGVQHLTGDLADLADDVDTPCDPETSSDRVYTFTLAASRTVRLTVQGESGAYVDLSAGCPFSAGDACLALGPTPAAQNRTLDPGTYFLIIDARNDGGGAYDVAIDFDSEPLGESCLDPIPIALGATPVTVTDQGHQSSTSHYYYYGFRLSEPSAIELSAEDPSTFWLTGDRDTIYRPTGELTTEVPAGKYCVRMSSPLDGPAFELTAAARPLREPGGRGCDDAIPLTVTETEQHLSGYASFGVLPGCTSFPAHVYEFELTEPTRIRATATSGFVLEMYRDAACTQLAYCSSGDDSAIDDEFEAGHYRLAVAGPTFIDYQLDVHFDCQDGCAVVPSDEDAGEDDAGEQPEPPIEPIDSGVTGPDAGVLADAGMPHQDAMVVQPRDDAGMKPPVGPAGDGSVMMMPDTGTDTDGSLTDDTPAAASSSGCACRTVTPRRASPGTMLGLMLFALAGVFRSLRRSR